MNFSYFDHIERILQTVVREESASMEQATTVLVNALLAKKAIYCFGASHAGILSQELFYRAGGLIPITPIFAREVLLDTDPITTTSKMERLVGYGTIIAEQVGFNPGDVLIVHSVSGRNPVTIEVAQEAKKAGATVIGLTNLSYSKEVSSRHPSGKKMYEFCDVVIDNHGDIGDACVEIGSTSVKSGPTSTVIGASILNAIVAEAAQQLVQQGIETPPIFYSSNIDGGDELNRRLIATYKDAIRYQF